MAVNLKKVSIYLPSFVTKPFSLKKRKQISLNILLPLPYFYFLIDKCWGGMHYTDLRYGDKDMISPSTLILAAIKGKLWKIYSLYPPDVPQSPEVSTEIKLKHECEGMFHSTGEVVFIHSDQVIKTCPSIFISAFSKG